MRHPANARGDVMEYDRDAAPQADREQRITVAADSQVGHPDQQVAPAHPGRR
jgi:hypothetical protein